MTWLPLGRRDGPLHSGAERTRANIGGVAGIRGEDGGCQDGRRDASLDRRANGSRSRGQEAPQSGRQSRLQETREFFSCCRLSHADAAFISLACIFRNWFFYTRARALVVAQRVSWHSVCVARFTNFLDEGKLGGSRVVFLIFFDRYFYLVFSL